jgi:hypothetical protein
MSFPSHHELADRLLGRWPGHSDQHPAGQVVRDLLRKSYMLFDPSVAPKGGPWKRWGEYTNFAIAFFRGENEGDEFLEQALDVAAKFRLGG